MLLSWSWDKPFSLRVNVRVCVNNEDMQDFFCVGKKLSIKLDLSVSV